jgi:hypothetical protein
MAASGNTSGSGGRVIGAGGVASGAGGHAAGAGSTINIVNNYGSPTPASPVPRTAPSAPLIATPADVFISYAHDDRARVEPLVRAMRQLAIEPWIDQQLAPGESFPERINIQIASCGAHIVAWSARSLASHWVRSEAELGRNQGTLIPVFLEPCDLQPPFNILHTADLSRWQGEHSDPQWRMVLGALAQKLSRPGLQELATLVQVRDGPGVRDWATRFPDDPFVAKKLR